MIASESEEYDSGLPTDSESRTQQRTFSSQKDDLSDYGTDRSSPDTGKVLSEKGGPYEAKIQATAMDLRQKAEERHEESASKEKSHTVTCTITICFAIPSPPKKEDYETIADHKGKGNGKHHKKVIEAPKAQKYFHFEYFLLPEDTEPTKVDVVMFGVVAKLYMEHETRLLKPWQENEKIWLTWNHSVELCVTKEVLLKALKHQIHVKVWSTKDKVSAKARFDRPKAFRVSTVKQGEDPEVKHLVLNQRKLFEDSLPRQSFFPEKNGNVVYKDDYNTEALKRAKLEKFPPAIFPEPSMLDLELDTSVKRLEMSNTGLSVVAQCEKSPAGQTGKKKSAKSSADMKVNLQGLQSNIQSSKDQKLEASSSKGEHGVLHHLKHSDTVIPYEVRKKSETERYENTASARIPQGERKCLTLSIDFMPLLAGDLSVISRLQECSYHILDCYVTLALNTPLLSDQQRHDLNPMVIRILSATCLPTLPTPISVLQVTSRPAAGWGSIVDYHFTCTPCWRVLEVPTPVTQSPITASAVACRQFHVSVEFAEGVTLLRLKTPDAKAVSRSVVLRLASLQKDLEKCIPVYCRYRFQDHLFHQTHGQTHGTHVFFKDVYVVFVGTMSPGKLREFLLGPPIEIEVHDRDQKIQENISRPSLFGMEPEDEKLSNVGLITSKSTIHNPFTQRDRLSDPYGIAKMRLSELVYGATYLNISVPILSCESPDATEHRSDGKSGGIIGSDIDRQVSPLPVGHYLDAQSHLKVRVDLAVPLSSEAVTPDCPFGRIIYIFDYKNNKLFQDLIMKITEINCRALSLQPDPRGLSLDAVSRVCLTDDQKGDTSLDVITGIHIMDGDIHLFILEGLRQNAVKELWDTVPSREAEQKGGLEILYNSDMTFHERLYKDLGVLVCHVHLHEPLYSLVNQPLLYIRDMVPPLCFQALSRLDYLCSAKKLRDVIQRDLLPSVEMIHLLSREFGVPLKLGDLFADAEHTFSKKLVISEKEDKGLRCPLHIPLDNFNENYIHFKRENENNKTKDHIQMNIDRVWQLNRKLKKLEVEYVEIVPVDGVTVHNYSSQTLNSAELALKILRQRLAAEPNHRYTYSLDYQSATVSPVDVVQELKKQAAKSRADWMTSDGFLYPGFRSSIESNKHPKKPDDARILELTKVWKENILHANNLQPTLSRDHWSWADRHLEFDLYKKPCERGSVSAPGTVQVIDETLQEEAIESVQPADIKQKMRFHRCLPQTERTAQGPHASNQQSRLEGLLKDKGAKLSLRKSGLALQPMPALAVIPKSGSNGSKMGINGIGFIPGELKDHSLKWTDNAIPCHNMNHETYRKLRGKDFTSNSTDHSVIYKRKIKELSGEEKNSFILLKSAPSVVKANSTPKTADEFQNVVLIQSHKGFLLHIQ
ncbi:uncharacterized protein KIAA1257 homolog [Bufo bufo]|uniref:uncharacterized protein KIAA1257 homolog n=1 Tax=Bufo bufo TaxID=8384 RepID=UPI001ABDFE78|nr:uncharacterized protein KIAA1257 homolog [Bufo bufo]